MKKNLFAALLLAGAATLGSLPGFAAEPSLHEVYQAAEAGRLSEAQAMMQEVLRAHPNSGKAHFVEAELLAKQGQFQKAEAELASAEKLAPGLPFAKPQAVENLKSLLRSGHGAASSPTRTPPAMSSAAPASATPSLPWGWLLGGLGLVAFIAWAVRLMGNRAPTPVPAAATGVPASYGMGSQGQPYAYGYGSTPAPAAAGSGLGSRIMGGLATGAAVGAGVVAGEAIARHFMHDDEPTRRAAADNATPLSDSYFNDLGGNDFGIADTASWDDGGGSGADSDWN